MQTRRRTYIEDNYAFLVTQSIENKKEFADKVGVSYSHLKEVLIELRKQRIVDNYIQTIDGNRSKYIESMNYSTPIGDAIMNEFDIPVPESKITEPKEVNELPNGKVQLIYESKTDWNE